jgi:hypothetical protein
LGVDKTSDEIEGFGGFTLRAPPREPKAGEFSLHERVKQLLVTPSTPAAP